MRISKFLLVLLFVAVFSIIGLSTIAAHEGHVYAETLGEITLTPSQLTGSSFTMTVSEDSGSEMVNAVQANIVYPSSLKVTSISTTGTAFDIEAENKAQDGIIRIARGILNPVSGNQKVAVITFSGTGNPGEIRVSEDSAIIRSSDNKNIYAKSQNYYAAESVMTAESDVTLPADATAPKTQTKKGFFGKVVQWNNSLWDKIIGLFSKEK